MIIQDGARFPDKDLLMQVLRFADPDRLLHEDGDIILTNKDNDKNSHRNGWFIPYGGRNYGLGPTGKIIVFIRKDDTIEDLVRTFAHEFRHMWQWYHNWKLLEDEELCEMDARVYAELMTRLWKEEDNLTWDRVARAKRIYVPVPKKIITALTNDEMRTKLLSH